jgi:hypothetical protein
VPRDAFGGAEAAQRIVGDSKSVCEMGTSCMSRYAASFFHALRIFDASLKREARRQGNRWEATTTRRRQSLSGIAVF